jgi:cell division protein FtsI/penicillin-binding protein 2
LSPIVFTAFAAAGYFWHQNEESIKEAKRIIELEKVQTIATEKIIYGNEYSSKVNLGDKQYGVTYTIDEDLQAYVEKLLKRYRSDYSSVVIIDNNTGEILANSGWARELGPSYSLNFSSTHPSASLVKIITSVDLLENDRVHTDSRFSYRGKGTTLYKYQLKNKTDRWTRSISFKMAFAHSNNVVFGKAAINRSSASSIYNTATKMGFNKDLMDEGLLSKSTFKMPEDQYNMAEIASGFNRKTMMSPIHAAVLSSIVANDGHLVEPRLIVKIDDLSENETIYENEIEKRKVLSTDTSRELKKMMNLTVKRGTARGSFRRMKSTLKSGLIMGGKTGSITGGIPFGKRDWFTMYAIPRHSIENDKGISIAVMNVNVKKWYVKSTFLAKKITEYYYGSDEHLLSYRSK